MTRYSQNDEQLFIDDYFEGQQSGKFIDIGAYDTFRFSNTRSLYEKGFRGILVEPAPKNFKGISEHYANEPRITVLNFAVGAESGEIDFYESNGDAVGTTDENHMKKWKDGGVEYTKIKVPQVSVEDFFKEYGEQVDMLSIDTEATNMAIFRKIPDYIWQRLKLVVIEHDGGYEEIEDKLTFFGFTKLYQNAENILMAKL